MSGPRLTYANVASTAALILAVSGGAWAATDRSAPTRTIHACAAANGALRLTGAAGRCPRGEKALDWNVTGQTGPAGATGKTGPAGQTGQTGAQGPSGSIVGAAAGGALTGSYPDPALAAGAVGSSDIAASLLDGSPTAATLRSLGDGADQAAAGNDPRLSDSRAPSGPASGSLTGTYPAPGLANGAVGASQIAAGAVGTTQLATGAVGAAQIANSAVGTNQIANSAVGATQLATGAVGTTQLATGAVGAAQIANSAVGTTQLADGAVTGAKVAGGSLTMSDLAVWTFNDSEPAGSIAAGYCLVTDVSGTGVGVQPGDLLMGWIDDTDPGLTFNPLIVTQAHSATIEFCNDSGANETFPTLNFTVIAVHP